MAVFPGAEVALAVAALRGNGEMSFLRLLKHVSTPSWFARRVFTRADIEALAVAITASEQLHRGELRFIAEGSLSLGRLLRRMSARQRAIELFSVLRIWDTAENCGVLIYVQLVDQRVEIIADRGIAARVTTEQWSGLCRNMEHAFRGGAYRRGGLEAIDQATVLLSLHFPARGSRTNELDDKPILL